MADEIPLQKTAGSSPTDLHGCPGREELIAFNRGTLPLALIKSLSTHIKQCALCEINLSTLQHDGETRAVPPPEVSPDDHEVNVQIEDSARLILVDLPIDFSRSGPSRLAKGSNRILEAPLQLGQYRLMEKIGQGGMGVVYKAWHERLKREVAIKFLPLDQLDDAVGIERFHQEMAAVGNVRHSNVVFATDAGESEGVHFLVMEYVQGIDLGKLVYRLGPLGIADACELIRQAAIGLEHIHRTGLVHRDLKPSNLMLAVDGTVKIMDLGLARLRPDLLDGDELTGSRGMMGTIDFISPEQSRDASQADIRSDIYSLGCTLFKLLCGRGPFGGDKFETVQEKLHGHRKLPPPRLGELRPEAPAPLEEIIAKTLDKRPGSRFQSPQEFAAALEALAKGSDLPRLFVNASLLSPAASGQRPSAWNSTYSTVSILSQKEASVAQAEPILEVKPTPVQPAKPAVVRPDWRVSTTGKLLATIGLAIIIVLGAWGVDHYYGPAVVPQKFPLPGTGEVSLPKELEKTGEYLWQGKQAVNKHITVLESPPALIVGSERVQLIPLGRLPGGRGQVNVTIDQVTDRWEGFAGIAFGIRDEEIVYGGVKRKLTVFQLIQIRRTYGRDRPYGMRVSREKVVIDPNAGNTVEREIFVQDVPFPGKQIVNLEVILGANGLDAVKYNGMVLTELTSPKANAKFMPSDYQGLTGLYNFGERGTKFSNIEISPLEPLK